MFIQEPFWELTKSLKNASYIAVNNSYDFLPQTIEDRGMTIVGDILTVLDDVVQKLQKGEKNE